MAADHLFVNATDATIADITAATATTAAVVARSVSAASSTSADVAAFLNDTADGARAVLATGATAAQKKAIAYTLLISAGVALVDLPNAGALADPVKREKFKLKKGVAESEALIAALS